MLANLPWLTDATLAAIVGFLALAAMFSVLTLRSWLADLQARRPEADRPRKKRGISFGLPDPRNR